SADHSAPSWSAENTVATTSSAEQASAGLPTFQLPAPRPSAQFVLPRDAIAGEGRSLSDVAHALQRRLAAAGYDDIGVFGTPGGFAVATRMERVRADGSPYPGAARWQIDGTPL